MTLTKPRLFFHKTLYAINRHSIQSGKISKASFGHAVLQLQSFGHSAKNCRSKPKCLICGESHSHKGCPNKEARKPKCANCMGQHVASYKGCPEYKKQAFRQHVVNNQKSHAAAVSQKPLPQPKTPQTFQFTAEQLTKFVANVVIQIAQTQVCYPNPKQDMLDSKSRMCRKISNVAQTILGVNITGKDLFESIGSLSAPAPPPPPPPQEPFTLFYKL